MTIIIILLSILGFIAILPMILDPFTSNRFAGTAIHEFANKVVDVAMKIF